MTTTVCATDCPWHPKDSFTIWSFDDCRVISGRGIKPWMISMKYNFNSVGIYVYLYFVKLILISELMKCEVFYRTSHSPGPLLLLRSATVENKLAIGSADFIWELCSHCLRSLRQRQTAVKIQHPGYVYIQTDGGAYIRCCFKYLKALSSVAWAKEKEPLSKLTYEYIISLQMCARGFSYIMTTCTLYYFVNQINLFSVCFACGIYFTSLTSESILLGKLHILSPCHITTIDATKRPAPDRCGQNGDLSQSRGQIMMSYFIHYHIIHTELNLITLKCNSVWIMWLWIWY